MRKKRKSQAKHFTEEEQEILRKNPCVRYVSENKVMWKKEFRQEMYNRWIINPSVSTIKMVLAEHGIDSKMLGSLIYSHICTRFKRDGCPSNGGGSELYQTRHFHSNDKDNAFLVSTGRFRRDKRGIRFTDTFARELYEKFPQQSVEEGLRAAGIDPQIVGYQRIHTLEQRFLGKVRVPSEKEIYCSEVISKYKNHPYVKRCTAKQFMFKDAFYNIAYPLRNTDLSNILQAFEIDPDVLSFSAYLNLKYKLRNWQPTDEAMTAATDQTIRIQINIMNLAEEQMKDDMNSLKEMIPHLPMQNKKALFVLIHDLSEDPAGVYTTRRILEMIGVSKTCYYNALKNDNYGKTEAEKDKKDLDDSRLIQEVIDYKGYPKGKRMVYMMMNQIVHKQFGLNKIQRLMRKYSLQCTVRKSNRNRQAAQNLLKKNVKPNLLKRTFRMHKPDEVLLTDVTYLTYGGQKRAYASACKDPVTGVLKAFNVSASNDLELVKNSLDSIVEFNCPAGMIFHSDQGALYLNDTWQNDLKRLDFVQSMSKRGNCWDNAPQESFFGHFKDETDLSNCETIDEVRKTLNEYSRYYNYERPQWTRNRMTPVQYAEYLKSMSEEDWQKYMENAQKDYDAMKQRAAQEAVQRASTLGV